MSPVATCSASVCEALKTWGIPTLRTYTQITMCTVYWRPPPIGHLKLNVDGAARGNPRPARGGGILRDHTRSIIFIFSHYYDIQTYTAAEAMAIHVGLLLCEEYNLHGIVLESDSRVLVEMLRVGTYSHW
ncbi:unnamed protein product [Spirodela intermedia]|uniref:RNase H type-1 domain-containing protein n=2 Tax=Spirodela intermedia TaxID=51605 RepID=A0A7I8JRA2_SPIIN|nr:unnamed protein product [Spirodela intermedia]CAA6672649.1 unnamed protein product [Spirodela intermedia]CAA7409873.1 unnamed protein product [Spirodela intermedia]